MYIMIANHHFVLVMIMFNGHNGHDTLDMTQYGRNRHVHVENKCKAFSCKRVSNVQNVCQLDTMYSKFSL